MYGTVARTDSWLLLEYPGAWRKDALRQSRLPADLKNHLSKFGNTLPRHRQVLVRQYYQPRGPVQCFFVRSSETSPSILRHVADGYKNLAVPDLRAAFAASVPGARPLYTVCTHGTHDKCCAKFGLPVYRELLAEVGDRVWQCSHIGGDRFAGNVVVFPYGIYYGRVTPEDVPALVERSERGEIDIQHYRGRCCYPRVVQAAEYFLRAETGQFAIAEFEYVDRCPSADNTWTVRFRSTREHSVHRIDLKVVPAGIIERLTCTTDHASPVPQYELLNYSASR
jgi:hypothetical protein